MNVDHKLMHLVRLWVQKAENDLKNATYMLTMEGDCPYDTVCFHAQQCVEKYMKAMLTCLQIDFPKTHDLPELLSWLPEEIGLQPHLPGVSLLNRYAVEARYPGDWEPITRDEAEEAVVIAQSARSSIRTHLPAESME